jgi:hypothetical protein
MKNTIIVIFVIFASISYAQDRHYFESNELSLDTTIHFSNCSDELALKIKLKIYTWHGGRKNNFDARSYYLIQVYEQSENVLLQEIIDSVDNWIYFTKYKNLDFIYDGNFDGQKDIFLCNYNMTEKYRKFYNVFTFNCKNKRFYYDEDLSGIVNPYFINSRSVIYSPHSLLEMNEIPVVDEYKFINNKLEKVKSFTSGDDEEKLLDVLEEIDFFNNKN